MSGYKKAEIEKGVREYLDGLTPTFLVTLNSKIAVKRQTDMENAIATMDRHVRVMMGWLREYCVGAERDAFKGVAFYERMPISAVLHCHLVVAVRGRCKRTVDQIRRKVDLKWGRFNKTMHARASITKLDLDSRMKKMRQWIDEVKSAHKFEWEMHRSSDVREISNFDAALNYCSKDFVGHSAANQFCIAFHGDEKQKPALGGRLVQPAVC